MVQHFNTLSFSFLSLFFVVLFQSAIGKELKFVVALCRHGDRTPVSSFPTNPVQQADWPQGFGQLTTNGIREHYLLGKYFRIRYKKFLSKRYNQKEIYVRSTDYDRTIMSAQAILAGLFPPRDEQLWNPKILWQPIPVHTVPVQDEKLLHFPMPGCKRFYQLLKETMGSTEVQSTLKSQMEFLGQMAKNMGYDVKSLMDFNNHKLWNAYDTLLVQKIHRKQLPSWANEDSIARLKFLMEYAVTAIFGIHKQEEKSRLQGGNLVKAILDKITKASQSNDEPKMVMYSAHDITIIALQIALGVFNRKLPPYSSCQFFELYKEGSGHTIEMYYRNSTYEQPHQLVLPSCTASCPLEKFKDLVSPIITNDWAGDCNK